MFKKLNWYVNRLRCMSVREMGFRFNRFVLMQTERILAYRKPRIPTTVSDREAGNWVHTPALDADEYIEEANSIRSGTAKLLWTEVNAEFPPDWCKNPVSGHPIPRTFGKTLDYRQTSRVGDIKYYWVLNRHHQIVVLAQSFALTKDPSYLHDISKALNSWLDTNIYPLGANWTSALELAIRLINWSATYQLCGGGDSPLFEGERGQRFRERWLSVIYLHLKFIRTHLSRHSSANNHLIGELSGLFIGSVTWPFWEICDDYAEFAQSELVIEAERQISTDGVSREQTIFYEHFVLEFLVYAGLAGNAAQRPFEAGFWYQIEKVMAHWVAVMSCTGRLPAIGDGDDALVLPLSSNQIHAPHLAMLRLGAALFKRSDFIQPLDNPIRSADWLLRDVDETLAQLSTYQAPSVNRPQSFPDGGYSILGNQFGDQAREVLIVFDSGPLGYPSIAAHGHADALAFTLSVAGQEILIDPGTYSYQSEPEWRDYFRSTKAHNTLQIDQQDQAVSGGKFMWLTRYDGELETFSSDHLVDTAIGTHDGYLRLKNPVLHRRTLRYYKPEKRLEVTDELVCTRHHSASAQWHFAPDVNVSLVEDGLLAEKRGVRIRFAANRGQFRLFRGSHKPILGWYAERFGQKEPTTTAVLELEIGAEQRLETNIFIELDGQ